MRVIEPGSGVTRKAPVEGGPKVEVLVGAGGAAEGGNLGAARVLIPPGGGMPEHEHGESEAIVVPQSGRVVIDGGGESETLEPGHPFLRRLRQSQSWLVPPYLLCKALTFNRDPQ